MFNTTYKCSEWNIIAIYEGWSW